jgi:hypothetical protein
MVELDPHAGSLEDERFNPQRERKDDACGQIGGRQPGFTIDGTMTVVRGISASVPNNLNSTPRQGAVPAHPGNLYDQK